MYFPDCAVTSASTTPFALTRWSMIRRASSKASSVGLPSAVRVIRRPPWRSRPSAGFQTPLRATRPYMTATPRKKMISVRPGRWRRGATSALLVVDTAAVGRVVVGRLGRLVGADHGSDRTARDLHDHARGDLDHER